MEEQRIVLEAFLNQHFQKFVVVDFYEEENEGYYHAVVQIPQEDSQKALMLYGPEPSKISIRYEKITPALVQAKIGDLVSIYHKEIYHKTRMGLVTSVYHEEDGIYYGVSYIKIALGDTFVNQVYQFELTAENYGGFHQGFLKVITKEELKEWLKTEVDEAYKKELERVDSKKEQTTISLAKFVEWVSKPKVYKAEHMELELDDELRSSVSMNLR